MPYQIPDLATIESTLSEMATTAQKEIQAEADRAAVRAKEQLRAWITTQTTQLRGMAEICKLDVTGLLKAADTVIIRDIMMKGDDYSTSGRLVMAEIKAGNCINLRETLSVDTGKRYRVVIAAIPLTD